MRPFLLFACIAAASGCDTATEPSIATARPDLSSAPSTGVIAGQNVTIEPYLWRDFMPSSPPDGKPLTVVVRIRAVGTALSLSVSADSIWVISQNQAWGSRAAQEQARSATGDLLEVVARDGPKWGPGASVDVVVRLRDNTGRFIYVRAADQLINRTD